MHTQGISIALGEVIMGLLDLLIRLIGSDKCYEDYIFIPDQIVNSMMSGKKFVRGYALVQKRRITILNV